MPLIDTEKAWKTAQRIYSDPVLLHAIKNVLDSTEAIEAAPVVHGRWIEVRGIAPFWRDRTESITLLTQLRRKNGR